MEDFWNKWTSYYFVHEPERILLAVENGEPVGYLTGAADSLAAAPHISKSNPAYAAFADQFKTYPAHLHINFTVRARGKGYGRDLIDAFIGDLKKIKSGGVHIVTAPAADNVGFYQKSGFSFTLERDWNSTPLLFMGKSIPRA
jgi:GNAT superfamily N-acetyltransferase